MEDEMHYNDWKISNPDGTIIEYAEACRAQEERINLNRADLRGANLCGVDLRGVDLSDADLSGATLSGATGPFTAGSFGRHTAIAAGGYISIGCERHTYDEWLSQYEGIGRENGYSREEIADYGAWIKQAVARQRRIEATNT